MPTPRTDLVQTTSINSPLKIDLIQQEMSKSRMSQSATTNNKKPFTRIRESLNRRPTVGRFMGIIFYKHLFRPVGYLFTFATMH